MESWWGIVDWYAVDQRYQVPPPSPCFQRRRRASPLDPPGGPAADRAAGPARARWSRPRQELLTAANKAKTEL